MISLLTLTIPSPLPYNKSSFYEALDEHGFNSTIDHQIVTLTFKKIDENPFWWAVIILTRGWNSFYHLKEIQITPKEDSLSVLIIPNKVIPFVHFLTFVIIGLAFTSKMTETDYILKTYAFLSTFLSLTYLINLLILRSKV